MRRELWCVFVFPSLRVLGASLSLVVCRCLQIRALSHGRSVGLHITDPHSVRRTGGARITITGSSASALSAAHSLVTSSTSSKGSRRSASAGTASTRSGASKDGPQCVARPGIDTIRTWMRELKQGELPTWNRGVEGMWYGFLTGYGTKFQGKDR